MVNFSLKHLNLQGNHISKIPYLQLTDSWKHLQTFIGEEDEGEGLGKLSVNTLLTLILQSLDNQMISGSFCLNPASDEHDNRVSQVNISVTDVIPLQSSNVP